MLSEYLLTEEVSPADSISVIETQVKPVISWATDWGISAGFAMLGVALFYQVVIILVKPDK